MELAIHFKTKLRAVKLVICLLLSSLSAGLSLDDFPAMSTPSRISTSSNDLPMTPIARRQETQEFDILLRVANVPPWIKKPKYPSFKKMHLNNYKYVDDGINTNVINIKSVKLLVRDGVFFQKLH